MAPALLLVAGFVAIPYGTLGVVRGASVHCRGHRLENRRDAVGFKTLEPNRVEPGGRELSFYASGHRVDLVLCRLRVRGAVVPMSREGHTAALSSSNTPRTNEGSSRARRKSESSSTLRICRQALPRTRELSLASAPVGHRHQNGG
jgi:hypothetical protein